MREMVAASLHDDVFPDSEERHERTAHCTSAHVDSLVGSVAGARGDEMAGESSRWVGMLLTGRMEGQSALYGRHCSTSKDMISVQAKRDQGAITFSLDVADACERVSLPVVWAWATHFDFLREILRVLCGLFRISQRRVQFEGCVAGPLQAITAVLFRSKWSCLLLRIVLQDALGEVKKVYPLLRDFVDDITAFTEGPNTELPGIAEKGLEPSITEEQGYCVIRLSGRAVSGMQQKRSSGSCNQRRNIRSGLEKENQTVGSKRESDMRAM